MWNEYLPCFCDVNGQLLTCSRPKVTIQIIRNTYYIFLGHLSKLPLCSVDFLSSIWGWRPIINVVFKHSTFCVAKIESKCRQYNSSRNHHGLYAMSVRQVPIINHEREERMAFHRQGGFGKFRHFLYKTISIQDIHSSKLYLQFYHNAQISYYIRNSSNEAATLNNIIFKRVIDRVDNSTTWSINGMKS